MNGKVGLIIAREYWTRVRKKTFLISTILTPLAVLAIMVVSGMLNSGALSKSKTYLVVDETGILESRIRQSESSAFVFVDGDIAKARELYAGGGYETILRVPAMDISKPITDLEVTILGNERPGFGAMETLQGRLESAMKKYNYEIAGVDQDALDQLESDVDLHIELMQEGAEDKALSNSSVAIGSVIGGAMGFIMYIVLIVYGTFVMRSVMEEKINRIVEVVISSVKPFQLMLGKIVGVGLVGLTQIAVWLVLIGIGMTVMSIYFAPEQLPTGDITAAMAEAQDSGFSMSGFISELAEVNWLLIGFCFVVFFFGGYFIYSSLFAAVGSAIGDDMAEGQSLTFPIMLPIIISIMILFPALEDPNGGIAVFGSIFPLTSPIIMPARAAFDPPMWQLLVSIALLIASCAGVVWLSGKIYRAGILLYGKKLSLKNLWQIIRD